MVYDILDKSLWGEDQVDYFIPLVASRISALYPKVYICDIAAHGGRLYYDCREA